MPEVAAFLRGAGLDAYVQNFEDLGYDDMEVVEIMDAAAVASCIKAVTDQTRFRAKQADLRKDPARSPSKAGGKAERGSWASANTLIGILSVIALWLVCMDGMEASGPRLQLDYDADEADAEAAPAPTPPPPRAATQAPAPVSHVVATVTDPPRVVIKDPPPGADLDAHIVLRVKESFSYTRWSLDEAEFHHVHIPRVGGASWRNDVTKIIPTTANFITEERCFPESEGRLAMVLLRKPLGQPLSIWQQCAHSSVHDWAKENIPPDFNAWIEGWHAIRPDGPKGAFCCANPIDMQSYRMSCGRGTIGFGSQRRMVAEADVDLAIENMKKAFFVGILEAYDESFCLFEARVTGNLPKYCNCADTKMWARRPQLSHRKDQELNVMEYPPATLKKLGELTAGDAKLYNAGLKRFLTEVKLVEERFKRKFLCKELHEVEVPVVEQPDAEANKEVKARLEVFLEEIPNTAKNQQRCRETYEPVEKQPRLR